MKQAILDSLPEQVKAQASAILLVGSYAERLQTETSDIDLFVILNVEQKSSVPLQGGLAIDTRRVEISYFDQSEVKKYLEIAAAEFNRASLRNLEIIYKLFSSVPLLSSAAYDTLVGGFNRTSFNSKLVSYYLGMTNGYYDDFIGHFLKRNTFAAIVAMQSYVNTYVDAWLVSVGDVYPKPQHRVAKAMRSMDLPLLARYQALMLPSVAVADDTSDAYYQAALSFCLQLNADLFLDETTYHLIRPHARCLSLVPGLFVYMRHGGYYVKNKRRVYKISKTAYLILLACSVCNENGPRRTLTAASSHGVEVVALDECIQGLLHISLLSDRQVSV